MPPIYLVCPRLVLCPPSAPAASPMHRLSPAEARKLGSFDLFYKLEYEKENYEVLRLIHFFQHTHTRRASNAQSPQQAHGDRQSRCHASRCCSRIRPPVSQSQEKIQLLTLESYLTVHHSLTSQLSLLQLLSYKIWFQVTFTSSPKPHLCRTEFLPTEDRRKNAEWFWEQCVLKCIACNGTLLEKVKGKRLIWLYEFHMPVKLTGRAWSFYLSSPKMRSPWRRQATGMDRVVPMIAKVTIQLTPEQCWHSHSQKSIYNFWLPKTQVIPEHPQEIDSRTPANTKIPGCSSPL